MRIAGTSSVPPGPAIPTAELVAQAAGSWDAAEVEARTGIASRRFADPSSTHAELGARALAEALAAAAMPPDALERILFVNSFGGDALAPATANLVAARLGLAGTCDGFDLNNGCLGFLTALDLAARSVLTGSGPVGLVMVELGSRYVTPADPRPFFVTADGVAAAVVDRARNGEGILGAWLRNDGTVGGDVGTAHPGLTGKRETIYFRSSHADMKGLAVRLVRQATSAVLAQAGLALDDVHWIVPHQPNGSLLAALIAGVGLDPERVVQVVRDTGSVGAASTAIGLDRLLRSGRARPRDRVLLVGVGAGVASGAILYELGE